VPSATKPPDVRHGSADVNVGVRVGTLGEVVGNFPIEHKLLPLLEKSHVALPLKQAAKLIQVPDSLRRASLVNTNRDNPRKNS